jgi:hypothetical protein
MGVVGGIRTLFHSIICSQTRESNSHFHVLISSKLETFSKYFNNKRERERERERDGGMKNTTFAIYYILLSYYFQKLIYCPVSFPFDIYFGQLLEIFDISVISPNDVRHD